MKAVIKILFVYIPFSLCVLIQFGALMALYTLDNKALLIKLIFPVLLVAAIVLHVKKKKNAI
jgi:hypothetical protein